MRLVTKICINSAPKIAAVAISMLVAVFTGTGCSTARFDTNLLASKTAQEPATMRLREGNEVEIVFPGAANLNTVQKIRPDGRITLPTLGEIVAAGLTPPELERQIAEKYSTHLVNNQVIVTVETSSYHVFVTGAVMRPGKIVVEGPLTALDAVMEAGGPDFTKANLKGVRVIRTEGGATKHFTVDLRSILQGAPVKSFFLEPTDIVYVPERFSWF
jgi:polysaccharide biosynthesis/export protein